MLNQRSSVLTVLFIVFASFAATPLLHANESPYPVVQVHTKSGETISLELRDVPPAYRGDAIFRLTKKPLDVESNIVWHFISIRREATNNISEIRFSGEPLVFNYPPKKRELHFYPITLISRDGTSEDWYWLGSRLYGPRLSETGPMMRVTVPVPNVETIQFAPFDVKPQDKRYVIQLDSDFASALERLAKARSLSANELAVQLIRKALVDLIEDK